MESKVRMEKYHYIASKTLCTFQIHPECHISNIKIYTAISSSHKPAISVPTSDLIKSSKRRDSCQHRFGWLMKHYNFSGSMFFFNISLTYVIVILLIIGSNENWLYPRIRTAIYKVMAQAQKMQERLILFNLPKGFTTVCKLHSFFPTMLRWIVGVVGRSQKTLTNARAYISHMVSKLQHSWV